MRRAASSLCNAQKSTATLLGTVTDAFGAAVPGASVLVTNLAASDARESQTAARPRFQTQQALSKLYSSPQPKIVPPPPSRSGGFSALPFA